MAQVDLEIEMVTQAEYRENVGAIEALNSRSLLLANMPRLQYIKWENQRESIASLVRSASKTKPVPAPEPAVQDEVSSEASESSDDEAGRGRPSGRRSSPGRGGSSSPRRTNRPRNSRPRNSRPSGRSSRPRGPTKRTASSSAPQEVVDARGDVWKAATHTRQGHYRVHPVCGSSSVCGRCSRTSAPVARHHPRSTLLR